MIRPWAPLDQQNSTSDSSAGGRNATFDVKPRGFKKWCLRAVAPLRCFRRGSAIVEPDIGNDPAIVQEVRKSDPSVVLEHTGVTGRAVVTFDEHGLLRAKRCEWTEIIFAKNL